MSLFGTSPTDDGPAMADTPSRAKGARAGGGGGSGGLFDEPSQNASSNSLFVDDDGGSSSPWDMPTPRKQKSRGDMVRSLLPASDVPDSYVEVFDTALSLDGSSGRVKADGIAKVFAAAALGTDTQTRIMSLVAPASTADGGSSGDVSLERSEFNVLLALVGLAQEGEVISLDGVDERRKNLPQPKLAGLTAEPVLPPLGELSAKPPQTPAKDERPAMDAHDDDPWNTPDLHKAHDHLKSNGAERSNGPGGFDDTPSPKIGGRTVSQYAAAEAAERAASSNGPTEGRGSVSGQGGWGYYDGSNNDNGGDFSQSSQGAPDPFGGSGAGGPPGDNPPSTSARVISGRTGGNVEENIVVTLMPEKEGMFMFQHHNYEVASQRRGSKVIRRYSDFAWLLDCLQKRYPFRILPLLPPKRMAVNGNHLSNDGAFIEKRRRGLARFLNALVRHPVLGQEQLVVMFLTVPTELAVWRKQSTVSVQDEFTDRALPPGLEDSLPPTLEELFSRTRSGVRRSAELYINICNVMDRLVKRSEGVAADHARVATWLGSLTETSVDTYATDTNEIPLLNDGLTAMSKHLSTCQTLLEDESRGWDEGVLEDLKRQRDALVSVREMFDRRERLDKDSIPFLERRIQTNETKLASLRAKPDGTVKAGEIERVAESIIKDKEAIVQQHNRSVFVKECIRDELITFQSTQYHVSRWNQDWAGERVKYAEMLADNWRQLLDELEGMPLGE